METISHNTHHSNLHSIENSPRQPHGEEEIVGDYIVGRTLGEGTFGKVKLGTHKKTKQKVALKIIHYANAKSESEKEHIRREIQTMKLLNHNNIVKLIEVLDLPHKTTCLVLEYVSGGELFDYIVSSGKLRETEAIKFFRQMIQGMEYCHANMVIHRDLKPENLLLDEKNNIKINDFGLSNMMKPGVFLSSSCGSPLYSAPEIISETNYIGPEVDIWSMGVILYVMVTGYLPWDGESLQEQVSNIIKANYDIPNHVSIECRDLIGRMLVIDQKRRATIAEVRNHPFINRGYDEAPTSCLPPKREVSDVDFDILDKLQDLGFSKSTVLEDIYTDKTTKQSYVLYFLMLDKKEKEEKERLAQLSSVTEDDDEEVDVVPMSPSVRKVVRKPSHLAVSIEDNKSNSVSRHSWGSFPASDMSNVQSQIKIDDKIKQKNLQNVQNVPPMSAPTERSRSNSLSLSAPLSPKRSPKVAKKGLINRIFSKKDDEKMDGSDKSSVSTSSASSSSGRTRSSSVSLQAPPPVQEKPKMEREMESLRISKGAFTAETTTTKSLPAIYQELERAFTALKISFQSRKAGYQCEYGGKMKMEVEVCKVAKLDGIKGVKFKRTKGDVWEYKELYTKLIADLHL